MSPLPLIAAAISSLQDLALVVEASSECMEPFTQTKALLFPSLDRQYPTTVPAAFRLVAKLTGNPESVPKSVTVRSRFKKACETFPSLDPPTIQPAALISLA